MGAATQQITSTAMDELKLSTVAAHCGGSLIQGIPQATVDRVSTDTRTLGEGALFVALKGENYDAHDFLAEAEAAGAAAVVVSKLPAASEELRCAIIRVGDTLKALQQLAKRYRDELDLKVVAITGSSGKTSTKDFIGAVLGMRYAVNATRGNLNNHIGLPLTMLESESAHECGVWELGMNHPGEIEVLAELAAPEVGVITNIGHAHVEFMKTRDAIAREKGMLAEAVGAEGCVILSAEDEYTESIRGRTAAQVLTAGLDSGDVCAEEIQCDGEGCRFRLRLGDESEDAFIPVTGRHMVQNAVLAAAVGMRLGVSSGDIVEGLRRTELAGGRLQRKEYAGITYLDDTYNANPDSMRAALETLGALSCEGKRIAVLGAMAELGDAADEEHRAIGAQLAKEGIDVLITVGAQAAEIGAGAAERGSLTTHDCRDHKEAAEMLRREAVAGDLVLAKGSRTSRMEAVLEEVMGG